MNGNPSPPDYDLADRIALTTPAQVKAIGHPLRTTILGLFHEGRPRDRAGGRPRAAEEHRRPSRQDAHRGRTAAGGDDPARAGDRGAVLRPHGTDVLRRVERSRTATTCLETSTISRSLLRSRPRHSGTGSCGVSSGMPVSEAQASEFWERMAELVTELDQLPRSGETVYGFAVGVYPPTIRRYRAATTRKRVSDRLFQSTRRES